MMRWMLLVREASQGKKFFIMRLCKICERKYYYVTQFT